MPLRGAEGAVWESHPRGWGLDQESRASPQSYYTGQGFSGSRNVQFKQATPLQATGKLRRPGGSRDRGLGPELLKVNTLNLRGTKEAKVLTAMRTL